MRGAWRTAAAKDQTRTIAPKKRIDCPVDEVPLQVHPRRERERDRERENKAQEQAGVKKLKRITTPTYTPKRIRRLRTYAPPKTTSKDLHASYQQQDERERKESERCVRTTARKTTAKGTKQT